MAEVESGEVSRQAFQVAYHGTAANGHTMDVEALAPALLAFGNLIREANVEINGDRATVRVLVDSDFERKCFHINFEIVQNWVQKALSLLKDDSVQTSKELLQTIGIISALVGTVCGSLLAFLKWKRGRKTKLVQQVRDADSGGVVILNIEGDQNNIQLTNNVYKLAENKKVLESIEGSLAPIEAKQAERIEFKQDDKTALAYDREDVRAIISSCESGPDGRSIAEEKPQPKITTTTLYSYGPVFDAKVKKWRFKYKKKPIYADISETSIAGDTMKRGGSFVDDRYRVRMEVIPPESEGGSDPHYKILEVLDFTQAPQQHTLPLRKPPKKKKNG